MEDLEYDDITDPGLKSIYNDPTFTAQSYHSSLYLQYRSQIDAVNEAGKAIVAFPGSMPSKARNEAARVTESPKYNIATYQRMFERFEIARSMIIRMADIILSVERKIKAPKSVIEGKPGLTDTLVKSMSFLRQWCRYNQFDSWLRDALICALWAGNSYTEVVYDLQSRGNWKVTELKLIPPDQMRPIRDGTGAVLGYIQYPFYSRITWVTKQKADQIAKDAGGVIFEPHEIIHLKINPLPGEAYGTSVLESIKDIISIVIGMREDIGIIAHNFAAPRILFKIGTELIPATMATVTQFKRIIESQMETSTNIVTSTMVDGQTLDTGKNILNMEGYFDLMLRLLYGSFGLPEILLGQGNDTTEATGKMQMEAFSYQVKAMHMTIKDAIELPLFGYLCVGKHINKLTPADMDKIPELDFGQLETTEDRRLRLENALRYSGITRQEWRKEYGMAPEPEGDLLPEFDKEFLLKQAEAGKPTMPTSSTTGTKPQTKKSDRDAEHGKKGAATTKKK